MIPNPGDWPSSNPWLHLFGRSAWKHREKLEGTVDHKCVNDTAQVTDCGGIIFSDNVVIRNVKFYDRFYVGFWCIPYSVFTGFVVSTDSCDQQWLFESFSGTVLLWHLRCWILSQQLTTWAGVPPSVISLCYLLVNIYFTSTLCVYICERILRHNNNCSNWF